VVTRRSPKGNKVTDHANLLPIHGLANHLTHESPGGFLPSNNTVFFAAPNCDCSLSEYQIFLISALFSLPEPMVTYSKFNVFESQQKESRYRNQLTSYWLMARVGNLETAYEFKAI